MPPFQCLLAQAFQPLWLVRNDDLYHRFTCVHHTDYLALTRIEVSRRGRHSCFVPRISLLLWYIVLVALDSYQYWRVTCSQASRRRWRPFRWMSSYLSVRDKRSTTMLSNVRPHPSTLVAHPGRRQGKGSANAWLVTCAPLVAVEHLRSTSASRRHRRPRTMAHVQRARHLPGQHAASEPAHDSRQMHEVNGHRDIGDVRAPGLVWTRDIQIPQQTRSAPARACG